MFGYMLQIIVLVILGFMLLISLRNVFLSNIALNKNVQMSSKKVIEKTEESSIGLTVIKSEILNNITEKRFPSSPSKHFDYKPSYALSLFNIELLPFYKSLGFSQKMVSNQYFKISSSETSPEKNTSESYSSPCEQFITNKFSNDTIKREVFYCQNPKLHKESLYHPN